MKRSWSSFVAPFLYKVDTFIICYRHDLQVGTRPGETTPRPLPGSAAREPVLSCYLLQMSSVVRAFSPAMSENFQNLHGIYK